MYGAVAHARGTCLVSREQHVIDSACSCLLVSQGQLGHGHTERLVSPALISANQSTVDGKDDFPYFVQAATGMAHTSEFSTPILFFVHPLHSDEAREDWLDQKVHTFLTNW